MSLSLEDRLLLLCSRVVLDENAKTKSLHLLNHQLNWDYLQDVSIRHSVAPLFYHGLKQVIQHDQGLEDRIPVRVNENFERLYQMSRKRNDRHYRAIRSIAQACDQEGIQIMGLKDVLLGKLIYPDPGLRPMGDIDLLIHFKDYKQVGLLLEKLGFRQLPHGDISYTLKYAWGHFYQRPEDEIWIDLQWDLMQIEWDTYREGNFDFEIDRMWNGSQQVVIDDFMIWMPRVEDMLFHLCHHLEGHHYTELILTCDIAELLKHSGRKVDWEYFTNLARKYQVQSSMFYPLLLCYLLFQVNIPPSILDEIRPTYLQVSLLNALSSNLTRLHLQLDEIQTAVQPPQAVMEKLEITVRSQAVTAMHLFREINQIVQQFSSDGGIYLSVEGTPSERLFPDMHLSAFGKSNVLLLQRDLPKIKDTFIQAGFKPAPDGGPDAYKKELAIQTNDPVLQKQPIRVMLKTTFASGLSSALEPLPAPSTREIAKKLLKTYLAGKRSGDQLEYTIQIQITPRTPEQLLIDLSQRAGESGPEQIYQLVKLVDFLRSCSEEIDWQTVADLADAAGDDEMVARGLSTAGEIIPEGDSILPQIRTDEKWDLPIQLFKWARLGPDSPELYARLKRPFYYLLCMLMLKGTRERSSYFWHSLSRTGRSVPVLFAVVLDAIAGSLQLLTRKQPSDPVIAYWIDPKSASEQMR
jgi:hypothetical protein